MKRLSHNLIKLCTQNKIKHNIALKQPNFSAFSTCQPLHFSIVDAIESGTSAAFLESLELQWRKDPNSVDPLWSEYFETISKGQELSESFLNRLRRSLQQQRQKLVPAGAGGVSELGDENLKNFSLKTEIISLVRSYQVMGHNAAHLDPLDIQKPSTELPELDINNYNISEEDLDKPVQLGIGGGIMKGFLDPNRPSTTVRQLYQRLRETYLSTIGFEYMHILDREQCNWLRERVELEKQYQIPVEEKKLILDRLLFSDGFESFLKNKYPTAKRFGLEGCEALIPGMKSMIDIASELGVEAVVLGMPHRGRLNVLANVVRKPLEVIFAEFQGVNKTEFGSGDVKYHLGQSHNKLVSKTGKHVHLTLCANPSHLEAVNPVVTGKVRAKMFHSGDEDGSKNMACLLHGDASFSGQGVVYETLNFAHLKDYSVGGTIHIVVNNQVGFTTNPRQSRSTKYCTDIAKFLDSPIFHVNADDVEAVVRVCKIATEFRQRFKKDVVIDLIGYRRHGHNEMDEPRFTQPLMYSKIGKHSAVAQFYIDQLVKEQVISTDIAKELQVKVKTTYDTAFKKSQDNTDKYSSEWLSKESEWRNMKDPMTYSAIRNTGVSLEELQRIGKAISTLPANFHPHNVVKRVMDAKAQMFANQKGFDWGTAEAMAFGTLLAEGFNIRLSGQDVERGTFSHRHCVLTDQQTEQKHVPLRQVAQKQGAFTVSNSHLSEFGVLGFEYGFSLESPKNLVVWEAQFGDFANGAQVIIDQFISCAEQKWLKMSGLVMLLPHGYEGQGPEHSNARLERYLQLSNENPEIYPNGLSSDKTRQIQESNWQVVNCSTPANYYHALRRQMKRDFRKPLIVMTPKSLLREPLCVSDLNEFADGTSFQTVIPDHDPSLVAADKVKRVVFCTGKVYYDLLKYRMQHKIHDVAVVRVEQLAPFPFDKVSTELLKYKNAQVTWCQEEPQNYGAWSHFYFRTKTCLKHHKMTNREIYYVGRVASSSPSTGFHHVHEHEQHELVQHALQ